MDKTELKEFVLFLYRNATFPELFFENVSAKDIIKESKLEASEEELKEAIEYVKKNLEGYLRIEKINSKYGFDTANEKVQIYESVNSDKIVKYLKEYFFTDSIIEMMNNGEILAIAYDDDGQTIIAKTISGDILTNILLDK